MKRSKITFSIIATITKAAESIDQKSACRWAKSNHQQQYTNEPCVVPWRLTDMLWWNTRETGLWNRDLKLPISSNMKTHWKQVSSFPDLECCPSSSQCQDIKALRMNTLNWTYRRSDCTILIRAVNSENRYICFALGSFRCALKCSLTPVNEFVRNMIIFWTKISRMGLYLKTKPAALSILVSFYMGSKLHSNQTSFNFYHHNRETRKYCLLFWTLIFPSEKEKNHF